MQLSRMKSFAKIVILTVKLFILDVSRDPGYVSAIDLFNFIWWIEYAGIFKPVRHSKTEFNFPNWERFCRNESKKQGRWEQCYHLPGVGYFY